MQGRTPRACREGRPGRAGKDAQAAGSLEREDRLGALRKTRKHRFCLPFEKQGQKRTSKAPRNCKSNTFNVNDMFSTANSLEMSRICDII